MKKITNKMLLGLLLCSTVGFAQVKFGAKAGLNVAALPGDYPSYLENKSLIGFYAGFTSDFKLSGKSSLVAEVLVSAQGGKTSYNPGSFETVKQTIKLTNLNVPILFRYKIIEKLSVEAGPQIGIVVGAKNKLEYTNSADPSQNETIELNGLKDGTFVSGGTVYSYQESINNFDFSVNLGVTYTVFKNLYLQARYNRGLTAVDKHSTVNGSTNSLNLNNSVFQFGVGYQFN